MAEPLFLNLQNAKKFLGDSLDQFSAKISINTEHNYHFFNISFSLSKDFLGIFNDKDIPAHKREFHVINFGNILEAPETILFNFECKCRADNRLYDLVIFKPWCIQSGLDSRALYAIQTTFFLCLDERLFLYLIRKSIQTKKIKSSDFGSTKVLNELILRSVFSYELNTHSFDKIDKNVEKNYLKIVDELTISSLQNYLADFKSKELNNFLTEDYLLDQRYTFEWHENFPLNSFLIEAGNSDKFFGYFILFENPAKYSKYFGLGFFLDFFFDNKNDFSFIVSIFESFLLYLSSYSTAINLYIDNYDNRFSDLLKGLHFPYHKLEDNIIKIDLSNFYFDEISNDFDRKDFSNLNFDEDPTQTPNLYA